MAYALMVEYFTSNKDKEHVDYPKIYHDVAVNPNRKGDTPMDLVIAKEIPHGGVLLGVIDVDDASKKPPSKDALRVRDKLLKLTDNIGGSPSLQNGIEVMARSLEGSENYSTIAMVVEDREEGRDVILTGSNGVNPALIAIDAITHRIVSPKQITKEIKEGSTVRGVNYHEYYLHPNRIYAVLGNGIQNNLTLGEMQKVINNALDEKKASGQEITIQEVISPLIEAAKRKMDGKGREGAVHLNDIAVSAFQTTGRENKPVDENVSESKEKNVFVRFFKRLLRGEVKGNLKIDLMYSSSINELSNKLSSRLPKSERDVMVENLRQMENEPTTNGNGHIDSIRLLNALLSNVDSSDIVQDMKYKGLSVKNIKDLMDKGAMWDMLSVMLDHKEDFLSALGVIMAEVPLVDMPTEIREKLQGIPEKFGMDLESSHGVWFICSMFSDRLKRSMKRNAILFVNGIPVKFLGKPSGLVLEDTKDGDDLLLEGTIVSFTDPEQKLRMQEAFDAGKTELKLDNPKIAVMRQWTPKLDGIKFDKMKRKLIEYKEGIPNNFGEKIGKLKRNKWRERYKE